MDFFNLMTLWYNKSNSKTTITRTEKKDTALSDKYKTSCNSTAPNEKSQGYLDKSPTYP